MHLPVEMMGMDHASATQPLLLASNEWRSVMTSPLSTRMQPTQPANGIPSHSARPRTLGTWSSGVGRSVNLAFGRARACVKCSGRSGSGSRVIQRYCEQLRNQLSYTLYATMISGWPILSNDARGFGALVLWCFDSVAGNERLSAGREQSHWVRDPTLRRHSLRVWDGRGCDS